MQRKFSPASDPGNQNRVIIRSRFRDRIGQVTVTERWLKRDANHPA